MNIEQARYIMEAAVTFFNVGCDNKQNFDRVVGEGTASQCAFLTVASTNVHFGVELALKGISELCIANFNPELRGHNLMLLFNDLPDPQRTDIEKEFNLRKSLLVDGPYGLSQSTKNHKIQSAIKQYSYDLPSILEKHKMGYVSWRYNYYKIDTAVLFFDYYSFVALFKALQWVFHLQILSLEKSLSRSKKFDAPLQK